MTALFVLWQSSPAHADLNELQPLNFGRWIITENDASYEIVVQTNGNYANSPQLIMLSPPQQGIYQITELPSYAEILAVNITLVQSMEGAGSEDFTLDNFQVLCPNADEGGTTTLTLGARARTSGSGGNYEDSTYNGTLNIDIQL